MATFEEQLNNLLERTHEENSRFWPVLYVGKNAAKDEEGS